MATQTQEGTCRFVYCSYWGTWSRLLSTNHPKGPFVEINLTPIGGVNREAPGWTEEVAPIRIRLHGTARSRDDKVVTDLPAQVKAAMVRHLGEALTERLLTEDFLPQIDWRLYEQKCNGGANLEDIRAK